MRASISFAILAAVGAHAVPQSVQPITQIADGQIQAPPVTAQVATASAAAEPIPVDSVQPITQIADGQIQAPPATAFATTVPTSCSTPVATATEIVDMPTAPAIDTSIPAFSAPNATVTSATPPSVTAGDSSTTAPAEQSLGAASTNMAPLGGLALAVLAFFA